MGYRRDGTAEHFFFQRRCDTHFFDGALQSKAEVQYAKNVRIVDTKHVSVGQCAVVIAVKEWLAEHPDATVDEAAAAAVTIGEQTKMCFLPDNLDYLKERYGLVYNEDLFFVSYDAFASNLMPDIQVTRKGADA